MSKEAAIKWFKQAQHDLEMAEKVIDIAGYDIAAFLAHQAVEKLMKALLGLKGKRIPRTHYLDDLAYALDLPEEVMSLVFDLTGDYTLARYPDVSDTVPYEQYTESIAVEKVASAKEVFRILNEVFQGLIEISKDD